MSDDRLMFLEGVMFSAAWLFKCCESCKELHKVGSFSCSESQNSSSSLDAGERSGHSIQSLLHINNSSRMIFNALVCHSIPLPFHFSFNTSVSRVKGSKRKGLIGGKLFIFPHRPIIWQKLDMNHRLQNRLFSLYSFAISMDKK